MSRSEDKAGYDIESNSYADVFGTLRAFSRNRGGDSLRVRTNQPAFAEVMTSVLPAQLVVTSLPTRVVFTAFPSQVTAISLL